MESESSSCHSRRMSGDIPYARVTTSPRYLKPRIGSCHDRCKDAIHDSIEVKSNIHVLEKIKAMPGQGQVVLKPASSMERKKKSPVLIKLHSEHHVEKLGSQFVVSPRKNATNFLKQELRPAKKAETFSDQGKRIKSSLTIKTSALQVHTSVSTNRSLKFKRTRRGGTGSMNLPGGSSKRKSDLTKPKMKIYSLRIKNVVGFLSSSPRFYVYRPLSCTANDCNKPEATGSRKKRENSRKDDNNEFSNDNIPEKTIYVIQPDAKDDTERSRKAGDRNTCSLEASSSSPVNRSVKKRQGNVCTTQSAPSSGKEVLRHTENRSTADRSLSSSPSSLNKNNQKDVRDGVNVTRSLPPSGKKILRIYHDKICTSGLSQHPSSSLRIKGLRHTKDRSTASRLSSSSQSSSDISSQKDVQNGVHIARSLPPSTKKVLRRYRNGIRISKSSRFTSSSLLSTGLEHTSTKRGPWINQSSFSSDVSSQKDVQNGFHITRSLPPSTKKGLRRYRDGIRISQSSRFTSSSLLSKGLKHTNTKRGSWISQSSFSSDVSSQKDVQNGFHITRSLPPSTKKVLRRYRNGIRISQSSRFTSSSLLRKGLKHTSAKRGPWISQSSYSSSGSSSGPSSSSAHGEDNDATSELNVTNMKVERKCKHRNSTAEDFKRSPPRKLKFRRGKVIEPQSENNGPRRLKFRQGRVLAKNVSLKGDARWRGLMKVMEDELTETQSESLKIALKRKTIGQKKIPESLFNQVIEETASKLVESRKSKVKALVGAFETVISLQDTNPAVSVNDSEQSS